MAKTQKKAVGIPTIDVSLVVVRTGVVDGDDTNATEIAVDTANKVGVEPQTETTDAIKLDAEQPIVEVARTTTTIPTEYEAKPDEFDLALRKYITQLNGKDLTNTRVPNINLSTLQTGTTGQYIILTMSILAIMATGIALIRKYVI